MNTPLHKSRPTNFTNLCLSLLVTSLLASAVGCQTAEPVQPVEEPSARPGVNANFKQADLNVSQWVERFEREGREVYDQREKLVQALNLKPGMRVADIGAGSGLFTLMFAEAVGPKGKVYAVDIAEPFIKSIAKRADKKGLRNIEGVVCSDRSVTLPPNSIDVAYICDTYHHFEYPLSTLASLREALKPGGEVLLVDFKRIPGETSEWALNHVRAGQQTVEAELKQAGFVKVEEFDLLKDNYVVRFRSTKR